MGENYYRAVNKKNFERIVKRISDGKQIGLDMFVSEIIPCKKDCLSVFSKNDNVTEDTVLTSIVFARSSFVGNHYIVIPKKEISSNNLETNDEPSKNLGYTLGKGLHRNICKLTVDSIPNILKVFSDKEVSDIDFDVSKKLVLIALKGDKNGSFVDRNEIKEKTMLVDMLLALRDDNEVFTNNVRMKLIDEFTSIYNDAVKKIGEDYFEKIFGSRKMQ